MAHASQTPHHFEVLSRKHPIQFFACEEPELTNYLLTRAVNDTELNLARTFVCIDDTVPPPDSVVGYFTLRTAGWSVPYPTLFIPTVEVTYLARHQNRKGEDWGNVLLSEACAKVAQAGELIGIRGVQLKPINRRAKQLNSNFGFRAHPRLRDYMFLLLTDIPPL